MRIINATKQTVIADNGKIADTFWLRLKGLLGTKKLPPGQGLVIRPCSSIHTLGMMYSIDVLFINENNIVVKIVRNLPPGSIAASRESVSVIELPAGTSRNTSTDTGDLVSFEN